MISVEDLAKEIENSLSEYAKEVTEKVKKSVDITAKEVNQEIKKHVTFEQPTGEYVKAFRVATTNENRFNKTKTWYVKSPHYRRAHLLENGHITKNGGRTKKFPHIKYGEDLAKTNLEKRIREEPSGN